MARIYVLTSEGFHVVSERTLPCGDSATDGEGGKVSRTLFDPVSPPEDVLASVFGAEEAFNGSRD